MTHVVSDRSRANSTWLERQCARDYGTDACKCFAGMMSVKLSRTGYLAYLQAVRNGNPAIPFDRGAAEEALSSRRDRNACGVASEACGIHICEPPPPPPVIQPPSNVRYPDQPWLFDMRAEEIDDGENSYLINRVCIEDANTCVSRESASRVYAEGARYWLLRGDAELATLELDCEDDPMGYVDPDCFEMDNPRAGRPGSKERALEYWRNAVSWGRAFGAQASIMAQHRLQAHTVQCPVSLKSLEMISRSGPNRNGDVISLYIRQAALSALGYYSGQVDGAYGPGTRDAIQRFQRELGYDETGSLSPRQTTQLICHAAQTARDPSIQNILGIMHATGVGVEQNTDLALEWLETAARRGDADANYNLGLIFGTGAVYASYRLCAIVESPERSDAYLRDAEHLGHLRAERLRRHPRSERWNHLEEGNALQRSILDLIETGELPVITGCLDARY